MMVEGMKVGSHWIARVLLAGSVMFFLPLSAAYGASNPYSKFAGVYESAPPPPDEPGRPSKPTPTMTVSLGSDGSATVTEDPGTGSETLFGHWKDNGGSVTVIFDPEDGKPAPAPMSFAPGHDGLQATSWNHAFWGKTTPPLMKKDNGNWHGGHHHIF
jgi:hypothetical protein